MRVDSGTSYQNYNQQSQLINSDTKRQASFATTLSNVQVENADHDSPSKVDFTNMTKKDLFNWMNEEVRAGRITVEESSTFLTMTITAKPDEHGVYKVQNKPDDKVNFNFYKLVNDSIEYAKSQNDEYALEHLRMTKGVMERYQQSLNSVV